ncbi:MAG: ThiF family adenylyltransferase [Candidatus Thermoplasmatota archaeon]|nr:ThiF family adenylyltransferase [Candidatus Thermoplasmatota archaeon]
MQRKILLIGAGGIGGLLAIFVIKAITKSGLKKDVSLTIMDGDIVEERNLPHQFFSDDDIGKSKVDALVNWMNISSLLEDTGLDVITMKRNFSDDFALGEYHLVIVAVDREKPRKSVHKNASQWLDLRARADGFVMWSCVDDYHILCSLPELEGGQSASCQLEGAVEIGNIQFGFALAAAHGAQWVIQWLREANVPVGRIYSAHMGELPYPEVRK